MGIGSFYLYQKRERGGSLPSWLSFGARSAEKAVERKFALAPLRSGTSQAAGGDDTAPGREHTFIFPGAGVRVAPARRDVICSGVHRFSPSVCSSRSAVVVFMGQLTNIDELVDRCAQPESRYGSFDEGFSSSGRNGQLITATPGTHAGDQGTLAAQLILRLFWKTEDKSDDSSVLILLSELQGEYAFAIYDADKRTVFAARDPSGRQQLYYSMAEDGSLALSNSPAAIAELHADESPWHEVPPGHFLAGRSARLQQFALTPEQLWAREYLDSVDDEDDDAAAAIAAAATTVPANIAQLVSSTRSHSGASEGDLFPIEV